MQSPESTTGERLRAIHAERKNIREQLATLNLHDTAGNDYTVPLASAWQPLPGRPGVSIFHIPNPNGEEGLFMTAFSVEPGSEYTGSQLDESRLLVLLEGLLDCNGHPLKPGNVLFISPGQPTTWHSEPGALGMVRYDVPNPFLS